MDVYATAYSKKYEFKGTTLNCDLKQWRDFLKNTVISYS